MSHAAKKELVGTFFQGRPLVSLLFLNTNEEHSALVDTGCDWQMVAAQPGLDKRLKLTKRRAHFWEAPIKGVLANGQEHPYKVFFARISWFGRERQISVHVPDPPKNSTENWEQKEVKDGRPMIMVGIELLQLTHLSINFRTSELKIELLDHDIRF